MNPVTITYEETVITYDEGSNKWTFTLRGRDRSADSLTKAKEYIDKPVTEKAKPFTKIKAWWFSYCSSNVTAVEIIGIAEPKYGSEAVWVSHEGKRTKETVKGSIFPSNEKNDKIVKEMTARIEQVAKLNDSIRGLKSALEPLVLPKD